MQAMHRLTDFFMNFTPTPNYSNTWCHKHISKSQNESLWLLYRWEWRCRRASWCCVQPVRLSPCHPLCTSSPPSWSAWTPRCPCPRSPGRTPPSQLDLAHWEPSLLPSLRVSCWETGNRNMRCQSFQQLNMLLSNSSKQYHKSKHHILM